MSRFLFTVWPFSGHLHPNLALAEELKRQGHTIAFYTGSAARGTVEGAGFNCFVFRHVDEALMNELVLSPRGVMAGEGGWLHQRRTWRRWILETVPDQVKDLDEVVASWTPDVLVCDLTMWAPFLILGEMRGIPVAISSLIPACHLSGARAPILGFPMLPPRNVLEQFRAKVLRAAGSVFLREVPRSASKVRQAYGLAPLKGTVTDFAGTMPLYLVPSSPEFDYQRDDLPPSVRYIGPCLWKGLEEHPLPEWVNTLPADQPLIYASEGTVHLDPRMLRSVAQGLGAMPVQVIITTGKHRDPSSLDLGPRPLAPNIHVAQWIPLNPLIPRLSAVITVGGPSTLMAALAAGVPVIVVPFHWDHPETGLRVGASGSGIHLTPAACTPKAMRHAVERLLIEPSFRQNALRLAQSFERCGGAPVGAKLIASLVPEKRLVGVS